MTRLLPARPSTPCALYLNVLPGGEIRLQRRLGRGALAGGKVRSRQMRQRRQRQVAIADLEVGGRLAQPVDDGGGNLATDGVGAEDAGVDMQKFHEVTLGIGL